MLLLNYSCHIVSYRIGVNFLEFLHVTQPTLLYYMLNFVLILIKNLYLLVSSWYQFRLVYYTKRTMHEMHVRCKLLIVSHCWWPLICWWCQKYTIPRPQGRGQGQAEAEARVD